MFEKVAAYVIILTKLYCQCSSKDVSIINGSPVKITEVPFMAMYRPKGDSGRPYHCGAVIVSDRFLLSAAHCYLKTIPKYRVTVGTDNALQGGQDYDIEETTVHPKYSKDNNDNDVLVIKIIGKILFSENVRAIAMASPDLKIEEGALMETMGFGWTNPKERNSFSNQLLKITIPCVDQSQCKEKFFPKLTPTMICAGGTDKDSCKGDSGGPLTYNNKVVGLVSYGRKTCGQAGVPAVYTRISAVRDFIDKVITP
ncbi:vitellin-degrading protease-like [Battus philenor]|uniref:vitellin-degrading protease-like n=1 Tax=Battus philenor TaxID=42288 RepID=UPI0035D0B4BD